MKEARSVKEPGKQIAELKSALVGDLSVQVIYQQGRLTHLEWSLKHGRLWTISSQMPVVGHRLMIQLGEGDGGNAM